MLINKKRKSIFSGKERFCNNIFSQSRGLIFRKKQNLVMSFSQERKVSLHMLMVFYQIEVILVNEKMKVVEINRNFLPFTFWTSKRKGKFLIELAENYSKNRVKVGDTIEIRDNSSSKGYF